MRILVTADIHLGSPIRSVAMRNPELGDRLKQASRDTFIEIVDMAISEKVDALVLAGDIFDNSHPDLRTRAFLISQLLRVSEAGIPTVLIRGNHDALLDHRKHGSLGPNIHLLDRETPTVEIGGAMFHGLSFETKHVKKSFLPDYPAPVPGKKNIGLMHTSLDGAIGHDPYAPCAESDLMNHGYDLWCLGHIHAPFEREDGSVLAVMPGIPQPRHFGERHGGSVALVSLGDGIPQFERRVVSRLGFTECELDTDACSDQQDVVRNLRGKLSAIQMQDHDFAVRLNVSSDQYSLEDMREIVEEVLESIEGVFVDKLKTIPKVHSGGIGAEAGNLVSLMRDELEGEGLRNAALQQLEDLRAALPREIRDELDNESIDVLLEEAMSEVSFTLNKGAA